MLPKPQALAAWLQPCGGFAAVVLVAGGVGGWQGHELSHGVLIVTSHHTAE